jgi:hypothetical protein
MYLNSIKDRFVRKAKHSKYLRRENSPKQLKYIKQNFHESEYVGIYNVSDQKIKAPMYHMCSSHLYINVTFFLSCHRNFIWIETLLRCHLSYKPHFLCPNSDLLIQVWLFISIACVNNWHITFMSTKKLKPPCIICAQGVFHQVRS